MCSPPPHPNQKDIRRKKDFPVIGPHSRSHQIRSQIREARCSHAAPPVGSVLVGKLQTMVLSQLLEPLWKAVPERGTFLSQNDTRYPVSIQT